MSWSQLACCCLILSLLTGSTAAETQQLAADLIEQFDRDGDGGLNAAELATALASGKLPLPANRLVPEPNAATEVNANLEKLEFIRVPRDDQGEPVSLDTSITSFSSANGQLQVDLIGAVHVGDLNYYEKLNREFKNYDVVLYELVAPEGTRIPKGGRENNAHPISRFQKAIQSMLNLSFQLDHIDYTAKHLVHADMSPDEFKQAMQDRGESFWKILFRMMTQANQQMNDKNAVSDMDLIVAFFSPNRSLQLKRVMAKQFENLEQQMAVFEGPNGSTIITDRNTKALSVLEKQLKLGHNKIGVFYGAGHMPDLSQRLQDDFDLVPGKTRWLTAWNLAE